MPTASSTEGQDQSQEKESPNIKSDTKLHLLENFDSFGVPCAF